MKRFFYSFLALTVFALCAVDISAEENEYTAEEIVAMLDKNFATYPWAHIFYNRKIPDQGGPRTRLSGGAYGQGEVVTVEIRKDGWRYEIKINFSNERQAYAKRSYDVKKAIYHSITELLPQTDLPQTEQDDVS
ncbi:MAG: hypothetical protein LBF80_05745 [Spirochaetaceae bacterium]|jgi:hypothetical protein|nr:hypothetical protein [Spirochaetaceae bacterium]